MKRGRWSTFAALRREYAGQPEIEVIWDRRQAADRRGRAQPVLTERRLEERRRAAPASWTAAHHVIVPVRRD